MQLLANANMPKTENSLKLISKKAYLENYIRKKIYMKKCRLEFKSL